MDAKNGWIGKRVAGRPLQHGTGQAQGRAHHDTRDGARQAQIPNDPVFARGGIIGGQCRPDGLDGYRPGTCCKRQDDDGGESTTQRQKAQGELRRLARAHG